MSDQLRSELTGNLPPPLRQVLLLRFADNLSYREISEALGIPEKDVGERLRRAREHVERILAASGR